MLVNGPGKTLWVRFGGATYFLAFLVIGGGKIFLVGIRRGADAYGKT